MIKKINLTSENITADRIDLLKQLFPEVVAENQIDWEKLRKTLGEDLDINGEKFNFTWAGKSKAIKAVIEPSKATLKPSKEEGIKFDESENIFIEGDNLEVLKLLQKAYFEKIKMIYLDPPYNTGGDFVYKDDFKSPIENYLKQTGQKNGDSQKLTTNSETNGRFHSDWLNMMYPRLKLAWNLLRDDGVILISIDDNEVHHLRQIMDEIFGEENFVSQFVWKSRVSEDVRAVTGASIDHEYILCYRKTSLFVLRGSEKDLTKFSNPDNDPRGPWRSADLTGLLPKDQRPNCHYDLLNPATGLVYSCPPKGWRYEKKTMAKKISEERIMFPTDINGRPRHKLFQYEIKSKYKNISSVFLEMSTSDGTKESKKIFGFDAFSFPKPSSLIKLLIEQSAEEDDIVLDLFAGSGTTAQAVMEQNVENDLNMKFVMVQLPEPIKPESEAFRAGYKTIADITKERIRRVIKGYGDKPQPIDDGFKVFKLDKSNYPENNFEYDPEKTEDENQKAFKTYLDKAGQLHLLKSTNDLDVIYENIVKEGLSLNSKVTKTKIGSNNVYFVIDGEQTLHICLEISINPDTVKTLSSPEYKNKVFICLDSAVNDSAKANLSLNLDLKTI